MPLHQLMDEVAEYWRTRRGLNVLRLPRGAANAWRLEELVVELDRVCIGVRSIEVSWLQPCFGGGGMYVVPPQSRVNTSASVNTHSFPQARACLT